MVVGFAQFGDAILTRLLTTLTVLQNFEPAFHFHFGTNSMVSNAMSILQSMTGPDYD
jgi:hypothetical protein